MSGDHVADSVSFGFAWIPGIGWWHQGALCIPGYYEVPLVCNGTCANWGMLRCLFNWFGELEGFQSCTPILKLSDCISSPWFFINIGGSTKSLHFEDAVYIIWECKIRSEGTKILDG
jgi:hypothetical protein